MNVKKYVTALVATVLILACGLVLGVVTGTTTASLAWTPRAPIFGVTAPATKVAEGNIYSPSAHNVCTDSENTVYVASSRYEPSSGNTSICVTKSLDGGLIWETSEVVASNPNIGGLGNSIAVSADPVFPGQKIVHTIWAEFDSYPDSASIYYSYYSTNTPGWSAPVRVNGSASVSYYWAQGLAVSSDGIVHIIFPGGERSGNSGTLYYTTSSAAGSFFTEPTVVTNTALNDGGDEPTIAVDSSNNVLVTWPSLNPDNTKTVAFAKKLAGSSQWETPVIISTNSRGDSTSIAAFDANNLYIACGNADGLFVYKSIDGGATWTKLRVGAVTQSAQRASIVINNKISDITVAAGIPTGDPAYSYTNSVFKSTDGGVTWSAAAKLVGGNDLNLGVDSSGKTIAVTEQRGSFYFTKEK